MSFSKKSSYIVLVIFIWISFGEVPVLASPFEPPVAPETDDSRFPEQNLSPPEEMRDGQSLAEKSFVMKMINILERKISQELGLRKRFSWNRDYVFEGDIILQKDQALQLVKDTTTRKKRKITVVPAERWDLPINYKFDGSHTELEREKIREGIKHWENQTCITFTNDENYNGKSIIFINDTGCYSFVGKQHGNSDQNISIGKKCTKKGTVAHEIGHVIGFWHEHARPDRDDHIKINYNNIFMSEHYNFDKRTWKKMDNLGVPYDVGSLMHYSGETFSSSSAMTVESWNPLLQYTMGQREDLSFYDVKLANLAYCNDVCNSTELVGSCVNDGYQDPKNCTRCRCPDGLAGDNCEQVAPSVGDCGGTIFLNASSYVTINTPGYPDNYTEGLRCYWLIQSPPGTAIQMEFNEPYMNSTAFCNSNKPFLPCVDFVEVRFTDNLGITGGRFCCDDSYQIQQLQNPIVSDNNHSLILFKSWQSGDRGISISLSIDSCGGCSNNVTSPQITCVRTVRKACYNTWKVKTKLQSCSYWMWCETQYIYRTVSRLSTCYEEEKYCCEGYSLENNTCVVNASVSSTPSPTEVPSNSTGSSTNSGPEKDQGQPAEQASGWSKWSSWGQCSVSCGGCGTRQRFRECYGATECSGETNESEPCKLESCNLGGFQSCSKQTSYVYECGLIFAPRNCTENKTTYYTQSADCCCGYMVDSTTGLCVLS